MRGFRRWFRWEMGRTIEVTGFIRFIIVERLAKGALLMIVGLSLIILGESASFHQYAVRVHDELNLDAGQSAWHRLLNWAVQHVVSANVTLAIGAMIYGVLEATEGIGLLLRRRWAEYLLLLATVFFVPFEIREVLDKRTAIRIGALLLNLVIVAYLVRSKRLFMEREGENPGPA